MGNLLEGGQSFLASGTINPASFVILDTANSMQVLQATSATAAPIYGVSARWSNSFSVYGVTLPPPVATIGQEVLVYHGDNMIAEITLGTAGCAVGDKLTADANGYGITTTTSGNVVGGYALQSGVAGDTVQISLQSFAIR